MTNTSLENAYAYAAMLENNAAQRALPRYIRRHQFRQIVPLADTTIYEMELRDESHAAPSHLTRRRLGACRG